MPDFQLRTATEDDAQAIAEIYGHYVRNTCISFEEAAPAPDEIASRIRKVQQAGLPYLVAEDKDGSVIGFAYASPFHPRSGYRFTVENSIYVAADKTKRGLGTALMTDLIQACTALGYRQMIALIGDSANEASLRLHRRLGFSPAGTLSAVGLKLGRWVDVVHMQLPLGSGATAIPDGDPVGPAS